MSTTAPTSHQEVRSDLIFDLGLHRGFDTEFYASKGFRVVGVEAVPSLAASAAQRLAVYGDSVIVVNKALAERSGEIVPFYTAPNHDDWGSLDRDMASKGVEDVVEVLVETMSLADLFEAYGVPRYVKCDLEGGDELFCRVLRKLLVKPPFASTECNSLQQFDDLLEAGYSYGQLVNQYMHPTVQAPEPAREGAYLPCTFTHHMSGLFGLELPSERWQPLHKVRDQYERWRLLQREAPHLAFGWVDVHVAQPEALPDEVLVAIDQPVGS